PKCCGKILASSSAQMTGSSTRRSLLRDITGRLATAQQRSIEAAADGSSLSVARPTSCCATSDDLRALAAEAGLGHRLEAVAQATCWGPAASEGRTLRPARELVLPRAWSAVVEPFELDAAEQQAWQDLRRRLADRQGVLVGDETERGTVLHRLGGYPDERQGDM